MIATSPRRIIGRWKQGYALDVHTVSSVPIGENEYGHMQFDTRRSDVGEALYKLKYAQDVSVAEAIAEAAADFVRHWAPRIDLIVPVPPSVLRAVAPVELIAADLGAMLGLPVASAVRLERSASQLKNVYDLDERMRLLEGLHSVDPATTRGKRVLLFDDLFRSGATMNAITELLYDSGGAAEVFALAITQTRSNR